MTMNHPYLEITYRRGKPLAAYLYLPRREGDRVVQSEPIGDLFVIDRASDGRVVGIEIIDPISVSAETLNELLIELKQSPLPVADLAPLQAA
jgi:uncharacterized protein YuzE